MFQEEVAAVLSFQKSGPEWDLLHAFFGLSDTEHPIIWTFDSMGYPELYLDEAEDFYRNTMSFGDPYADADYFGYWSEDNVFGLFWANPRRHGMPRPGETSAYVSFWIGSVQETFDLLDSMGASFPKIGAINSRRRINSLPGYIQIYTLDSEGNGLTFTEYPGN